jgi:predicted ester cyclase
VVTRWKASGTHQGDFFGVPASGERVELSGKIVEACSEYHLIGAMRQIGAIPEW